MPEIPNVYHKIPTRDQATIDAAYYEALTSPAGIIVMDDLYRVVCTTYHPDASRGQGQLDLRNYLLERLQAHEARLGLFERER